MELGTTKDEEAATSGLGSHARFEAGSEQIGEEARRGGGGTSNACWSGTL
jgi:hypothetical protein